MKQLFLFLLTCWFGGSVLLGQATLQGSLYDRGTGLPLRNVAVVIEGTTLGDVTDKAGYFAIQKLSPGWYQLKASQDGYESKKVEIEIKLDQAIVSMGIALRPSVAKLHPDVIITAERHERDPFYSSASISTFDGQQLRYESPRTLPQALQNLPGIWAEQPYYGGSSLLIRGMDDQRTALMVDGIRLQHAAYGTTSHSLLSMVDPFSMQRVEVLRGGGANQYETDAIGGAIQLFTKNPRFADQGVQVHGSVLGRWMSQGMERSFRPELELSSKRVAIHAGVSLRHFGDLMAAQAIGIRSATAYDQSSVDVKARIKLSPRHEFTLAHQQTNQDSLMNWNLETFGPFSKARFTEVSRSLTYARMTSFLENKWFREVRLTSAWQRVEENRRYDLPFAEKLVAEREWAKTWSGQIEVHSKPSVFWQAVSGLEYYRDFIGDVNQESIGGLPLERSPGNYQGDARSTNLGMYSQHSFDILDLKVNVGGRARAVRMENVSAAEEETLQARSVVGNISSLYPLHPNWHVVSSFHTGFRTPDAYDLDHFGYLQQGAAVPNDSLGAERSRTTELGLKAKTRHFSGTVTLYQTRFQDHIDWVPTTYDGSSTLDGQQVFQQQNTGQAFVRGIEAAVEVPVNQALALYGGVSYLQGQNITEGEPLSNLPPLNGRLGLRFRSRNGIWSNLEWRQASTQTRIGRLDQFNPGIMPTGAGSWQVVDLHMGYDFAWGYATIGIQNLLDEAYTLHGSALQAPGRVVLMSVQLGF
ncbi:MAG: TonB-dependent receptor [Bacteroidota bacterium]